MGLSLDCYGAGPFPRPVTLTLVCDGDHGLFAALDPILSERQSFNHPDGFIGSYGEAMRVGWKESRRDGARIFLCPNCSGK